MWCGPAPASHEILPGLPCACRLQKATVQLCKVLYNPQKSAASRLFVKTQRWTMIFLQSGLLHTTQVMGIGSILQSKLSQVERGWGGYRRADQRCRRVEYLQHNITFPALSAPKLVQHLPFEPPFFVSSPLALAPLLRIGFLLAHSIMHRVDSRHFTLTMEKK